MMKKLVGLFCFAVVLACSSKTGVAADGTTTSDYGYSQKNPIKVGGFTEGPAKERQYLNSLTGPNGEPLWYERSGSCCGFETKNSPFGGGMLDIYRVTYEGKGDTVSLYLNMYDSGKLGIPKGFKAR